jgi:hypothetical protein
LKEIFNDLHDQIESNREDDKCKTEQINLSEMLTIIFFESLFFQCNFFIKKKQSNGTRCLDASQKYINVIENELKLVQDCMHFFI